MSFRHIFSADNHNQALSLDAYLRSIAFELEAAGVDSPRLSAEVILAHTMGCDRQELLKRIILQPETRLSPEQIFASRELAARRANGEPVAYLTGVKEFYGRCFSVDPAVLVPRPETELLVDLALGHARQIKDNHHPIFADFGTGSGCIAISLALELNDWQGLALDISPAALSIARRNALANKAEGLYFMLADFMCSPLMDKSLDLIVSNPPYISEAEYAELSLEVRNFEPKKALVPSVSQKHTSTSLPASGLEHAQAVIGQAERVLKPGGILLLEIGCSQGELLRCMLAGSPWREISIHKDLAGHDRALQATKKHD